MRILLIVSLTWLWLNPSMTWAQIAPTSQVPRVPNGVKAYRDLEYVPRGHERHKLDLFIPEMAGGPLPIIVWVHGGGWQNGSKEGCPPLRSGYTERGFAVASINYRLSSHAIFPAQIEDCKAAIRWLRANAAMYNLDIDRIGVWGSSAGGHLVSLLGTTGDIRDFDVGANLEHSSRVQAVCDYYGPTDFGAFVTTPGYESHAKEGSPESKLIGGQVLKNRDKVARANPITFVSRDDPPFLIIHGDRDTTVPINQSQALFEALRDRMVSAHFHTIKGAGHGNGFGGTEIAQMVSDFFEGNLKSHVKPAVQAESKTSESVAFKDPPKPQPRLPANNSEQPPRISWNQILQREDLNGDERVTREEFKGPPPLFNRLDRNQDNVLTADDFIESIAPGKEKTSQRIPRDPVGGTLFYAKEGYQNNTDPIANPNVIGGWIQFYWSDIEKESGQYDWSLIDLRMKPWVDAGKKVAFRVYWIGSGYWRDPSARVPTPSSVWADGAKFVKHDESGTEIPLIWDPIYQRRAFAFLSALAERYDANPNVLFFDVTPGAETNPYRFVAFNQRTPEFKDKYAAEAASDGRKYSDELWQATLREWINAADARFHQLPLVVTLNVGTLNTGSTPKDYSIEIGQYAVDRGFYVGQNGLHGASYLDESARKSAFLKWSGQTRIVFETLGDAGTTTAYGKRTLGSLREIIDAANRVHAHYLLPYPVDVLKGTSGQSIYDPEFASALEYGARTLGRSDLGSTNLQAAAVEDSNHPRPANPQRREPTSTATNSVNESNSQVSNLPVGFQVHGDRWTYRDDQLSMTGILLKPEGQGPFPAILISHGLGGNAEGFGMNKAREFVKWGCVCIAPNYTHTAGVRKMPGSVPSSMRSPPRTQVSNYGASSENIQRASKCLDLVASLSEVDGKKLFAYGHSMGGFVTLGLAATFPDRLQAAAISGSGIAPTSGFAAPSHELAKQIKTPLIMFHGANDNTVRPSQSQSLKELLDSKNIANERHLFEGIGHPVDQQRAADVYRLTQNWFSRYGLPIATPSR